MERAFNMEASTPTIDPSTLKGRLTDLIWEDLGPINIHSLLQLHRRGIVDEPTLIEILTNWEFAPAGEPGDFADLANYIVETKVASEDVYYAVKAARPDLAEVVTVLDRPHWRRNLGSTVGLTFLAIAVIGLFALITLAMLTQRGSSVGVETCTYSKPGTICVSPSENTDKGEIRFG